LKQERYRLRRSVAQIWFSPLETKKPSNLSAYSNVLCP